MSRQRKSQTGPSDGELRLAMGRTATGVLPTRKKGRDVVRGDGARIRKIVNELTGWTGGVQVDYYDGRQDAVAIAPVAELGFDRLGIEMSEFQRRQYDRHRASGKSHELALFLTK